VAEKVSRRKLDDEEREDGDENEKDQGMDQSLRQVLSHCGS